MKIRQCSLTRQNVNICSCCFFVVFFFLFFVVVFFPGRQFASSVIPYFILENTETFFKVSAGSFTNHSECYRRQHSDIFSDKIRLDMSSESST